MTPNQSLEKSCQLREYLRTDYLQGLYSVFPFETIEEYDTSGYRDRIYNCENTVLTMVYSATQSDKTLKNSTLIFNRVFENQSNRIINQAKSSIEEDKKVDLLNKVTRRGPKKKYKLNIPKSKISEVSCNTAAYSKARKRIDFKLLSEIFKKTALTESPKKSWHGMNTFITDGTYVQMQDTPELRKIYDVKHNGKENVASYPQALIQAITEQGTGCVYSYAISDRHTSELLLISQLISGIPERSILLADDLYNSFAIFSLAIKNKIELIVSGKRVKAYKVIEEIAEGDEIVEIKKTSHPKWLSKDEVLPSTILLRRLSFLSPDGSTQMVIYTTLLRKDIEKSEIIIKYFTRWDIEITIREVKNIMDINVLRGKTDDIVKKELISAFIGYNLVRKLIIQSTKGTVFFPKTDIIQEFFENNKDVFMDRKGRVYKRWSTGRYEKVGIENH